MIFLFLYWPVDCSGEHKNFEDAMTTRFATAFLVATVGTILSVQAAYAFPPSGVPSTTNPGLLNGNGAGSEAIFAFADAADTSILNLTGFAGNPIFNNSINAPGQYGEPRCTVRTTTVRT